MISTHPPIGLLIAGVSSGAFGLQPARNARAASPWNS